MNFSRQLSVVVVTALFVTIGCDRQPAAKVDAHVGQGQPVTVDPTFEITLTIDGAKAETFGADRFAVHEAKPAKDPQKTPAQTFELVGKQFALGGALPAEIKLAPRRAFDELVGKTLEVRAFGGDPTAPTMSKLSIGEDRVYVAKSGNLTVEKAFHKPGQYAGVSGTFDVLLQQIKLGDTDDPNNKGDQPIGEPVKASGTFSVKATSIRFESM